MSLHLSINIKRTLVGKWGWFIATGIAVGTWLRLKSISIPNLTEEDEDSFDAFHKEWSKQEKASPKYQQLLEKWGTREGVIDVRFGDKIFKKESRRLKKQQFDKIVETASLITKAQRKKLVQVSLSNTDLEAFDTTQVTLDNTTDTAQAVQLWGGNLPLTLEDKITGVTTVENFNAGIAPVAVAYNPLNQFFYVVNQLSESVQVVDVMGQEIHVFELKTSTFVGGVSPVAISIIEDTQSPYYGYGYVVGSISNKVYELSPSFKIERIFSVGKRPIGIVSGSERLLVINLQEHTISSINLTQGIVEKWTETQYPRDVKVHPITQEVYVFSEVEQRISIFSSFGELKSSYVLGANKGQLVYFPPKQQMLFLDIENSNVTVFDSITHSRKNTVIPEAFEFGIYNPKEEQLLLGSNSETFFRVYDKTLSEIESIPKEEGYDLFSFSNQGNTVLGLNRQQSNGIAQFSPIDQPVLFNEGYETTRKDFQHNPAILKHLKIIHQSDLKVNTINFISKSVAGKEIKKVISIGNYDSPQHFSSVSEISDLQGISIDGRNRWEFTLPPKARISLVLYHLQYDTYNLLPETARKSIGVSMSKGLLNQKKI